MSLITIEMMMSMQKIVSKQRMVKLQMICTTNMLVSYEHKKLINNIFKFGLMNEF